MKLGYTIIYVSDVTASLAFFEAAFGFTQKQFVPTGEYGELNTGETTLAFAQHALGNSHFPEGYVRADQSDKPLGMEIALLTADVASAHDKAVKWAAVSLNAPQLKPWGQTVSYIRAPDGTLIELCTPMTN